jgi:hypothetical protein
MQEIQFEVKVKNGYIKVPERYSRLNNKEVVVEIIDKDISLEKKEDRVKKAKEYLRKYSGILAHTQIPPGISMKDIKDMRLNEKYGQ